VRGSRACDPALRMSGYDLHPPHRSDGGGHTADRLRWTMRTRGGFAMDTCFVAVVRCGGGQGHAPRDPSQGRRCTETRENTGKHGTQKYTNLNKNLKIFGSYQKNWRVHYWRGVPASGPFGVGFGPAVTGGRRVAVGGGLGPRPSRGASQRRSPGGISRARDVYGLSHRGSGQGWSANIGLR